MKVFAVIDGCGSDRIIKKVFSNQPAAEEYRKWHNINNEVEGFEVYDEPFTEAEGRRAMLVYLQGTVGQEAVADIKFKTRLSMTSNNIPACDTALACINHRFKGSIDVYASYYIPIEFWDEAKWKAKISETLLSLVAVAKVMFAEGYSTTVIENVIEKTLIDKFKED